MKTVPDAVVIGGGPVGSFTAFKLARQGIKVAVFEEHAEIGVPSHCAGHLGIRSLRSLGLYPLPGKIVENTFSQADFYSPMGTKLSVRLARPVTCTVNRTLLDKHLAEKAQTAGALYYMSSQVNSLLVDNGFVKGVSIVQDGSRQEQVSAKIIVDAEGISSRLLRQAGLSASNREGLVYAVEAEVENVKNVELDAVEVFLGKKYAPGFYAWLIPKPDGTAKVGLATRTGNPKKFLQELMLKHPVASKQLGAARINQTAFHAISLGGPVSKAYADGFLAVGDAASQVKPTTGGGVVFGLTCAGIAAQVAHDAIRRNDVSSNCLRLYQERCNEALGFDVKMMLRMRSFLSALSDEQLDGALRFCARMGLSNALKNVEEIDFQGQTLLTVLHKPPMWAALAYFVTLYLAANP